MYLKATINMVSEISHSNISEMDIILIGTNVPKHHLRLTLHKIFKCFKEKLHTNYAN